MTGVGVCVDKAGSAFIAAIRIIKGVFFNVVSLQLLFTTKTFTAIGALVGLGIEMSDAVMTPHVAFIRKGLLTVRVVAIEGSDLRFRFVGCFMALQM